MRCVPLSYFFGVLFFFFFLPAMDVSIYLCVSKAENEAKGFSWLIRGTEREREKRLINRLFHQKTVEKTLFVSLNGWEKMWKYFHREMHSCRLSSNRSRGKKIWLDWIIQSTHLHVENEEDSCEEILTDGELNENWRSEKKTHTQLISLTDACARMFLFPYCRWFFFRLFKAIKMICLCLARRKHTHTQRWRKKERRRKKKREM